MHVPPASLLLLSCVLCASLPARGEEIRIEVSRGAPFLLVSGADLSFTQGVEAKALATRCAPCALSARAGTLLLQGVAVQEPLVIQPGAQGLSVAGKKLPGRIEVWAEKSGLVVVNALDLEEYVSAVVASEVPGSWPLAALQAQAVAARTFAVAQKIGRGPGSRSHLGSSVLGQVYAGAAHPQSGAREGAKTTAGEVLTWDAAPIQAFFSASCGGTGESGEAAFGLRAGSAPYLPGGDDGEADAGTPRLAWAVKLRLSELTEKLRAAGRVQAEVVDLSVARLTATGRARQVKFELQGTKPLVMSGAEFRQLVGYQKLPSLLFTVVRADDTAVFTGRGSGHGVGLCQWGARGRAARGEGYRDILAHYYPGAEIRRMY